MRMRIADPYGVIVRMQIVFSRTVMVIVFLVGGVVSISIVMSRVHVLHNLTGIVKVNAGPKPITIIIIPRLV